MSEVQTYKIKIEGAGLSVDREVPKDIGDQIVVLLLTGRRTQETNGTDQSGAQGPGASGSQIRYKAPDSVVDMSIREFLDDRQAKRVPDKIAAIGVYLRDHREQPSFTREDLVNNFEDAADPVPKNIARDIKWTLKAGWIAQRTGQKDLYYVTQSGNNAVQQRFSPEVVKKTRGMFSGGKREMPNPEK